MASPEKPIRFVGDFNNDAGPIVRLTKGPGFGPITLNSRNGVGNEYTIGDTVLDFGGVYNIWIDVENKSNEDGDVYSVYIAEEGQAERTVVFENFVSDRNPAGTVDLGKPKADLLSLLVMSSSQNAGVGNLLFDDHLHEHRQIPRHGAVGIRFWRCSWTGDCAAFQPCFR